MGIPISQPAHLWGLGQRLRKYQSVSDTQDRLVAVTTDIPASGSPTKTNPGDPAHFNKGDLCRNFTKETTFAWQKT